MTKQVERPKSRDDWAELLSFRIDESGLSARQFAIQVMRRDERTIRRWIAGDSPIPQVVEDFLLEPTRAPWP